MRVPTIVAVVCCLMAATLAQAQTVQSVNLLTNHILYEPVSGKIHASVPSNAGSNANSATVGGVVVNLTSSNPSILLIPSSVTVPEGVDSVSFGVQTSGVKAVTRVTVSSRYNSIMKSTTLTVSP